MIPAEETIRILMTGVFFILCTHAVDFFVYAIVMNLAT